MLDHSLLEKYIATDWQRPPEHHWTNFLGLHTDTRLFHEKDALAGQMVTRVPIPDDGVYGGSVEYIALLTSIDERLKAGANSFTAIELGAGWGPWISAAGVVCKKNGIDNISLVAVEADKDKAAALGRHLETNGLSSARINSKIMCGAAWNEDTTLYFPKSLPMHDWGAGPSAEKKDKDYRGFQYETDEIPAYSLETICAGLDVVDFSHWDLQGAEWPVASSSVDLLKAKFRYLFIGTHSRKIEGDLLGLFHGMGWDLLHHSPCAYTYDRERPSLEGMTTTDGSMFFRNPHIA